MAVVTQGVILAHVNHPVVTHNEKELVEIPDPDGGEPTIVEEWVPVYANPGDVIDVAHWHNVGAWQERGHITLLNPSETREYLASQAQASAPAPAAEATPVEGDQADQPAADKPEAKSAKTKKE